jgi:hypothetical protein
VTDASPASASGQGVASGLFSTRIRFAPCVDFVRRAAVAQLRVAPLSGLVETSVRS